MRDAKLVESPALLPVAGAQSLCPLIMVGDPNINACHDLLSLCVERGITMIELCSPFSNPFTDGPTLRRAHARALGSGANFEQALELTAAFSSRLAIVMLADCAEVLRPLGFLEACRLVHQAGAAAILPHGLPPMLRAGFLDAAKGQGLPVVGTIYANGSPATKAKVLKETDAFVYVVSSFGRSGKTNSVPDIDQVLAMLRPKTDLPLALGFGLRTGADVTKAFGDGADIAIVGSAISAAIERGIKGHKVEAEFVAILDELTGARVL